MSIIMTRHKEINQETRSKGEGGEQAIRGEAREGRIQHSGTDEIKRSASGIQCVELCVMGSRTGIHRAMASRERKRRRTRHPKSQGHATNKRTKSSGKAEDVEYVWRSIYYEIKEIK